MNENVYDPFALFSEENGMGFEECLDRKIIVTLCGSGKFYDKFIEVEQKLTDMGCLVFKPAYYYHTRDKEKLESRTDIEDVQAHLGRIQQVHFAKIYISDYVFIINQNDYIGEATQNEIDYAYSLRIPIIYLEEHKEEKDNGNQV